MDGGGVMGERFQDWPRIRRQLWLWGKGGYFWLDVDAAGRVSIPEGEKPWRALWDYGPTEMVKDAYCLLGDWFETEGATLKVGPEAAARFGKQSRDWLREKKLNRRQAEGEAK